MTAKPIKTKKIIMMIIIIFNIFVLIKTPIGMINSNKI